MDTMAMITNDRRLLLKNIEKMPIIYKNKYIHEKDFKFFYQGGKVL
jgi:hypothetical protein